ncbi:MAG TPA: SDR family oxidoreductase [Acidimicrobiales bacterium]|jgi:meso-butanediol dehydrogenase/(S,S)-butanediol dehydrogenase/diacetyl reductase|nr:SDR family oxidoreductase [Acidimicrobiales bacterium]
MGSLDGKVALVTGAVRKPGIGRATIHRLSALGASVVCADKVAPADHPDPDGDTTVVRAELLESLLDELRAAGRAAVAVDLDAADGDSVARGVRRTVMEFGRLDICCHLGGGTSPDRDRPLMELDDDGWDVTVARNLTSVFLLNRAAAAQMIKQGDGGAIVNLGSFAAVRLGQGPPAFSAAKAGAEALTKLFARELAPHAIRVNIVHPLGVDAGEGAKNPGLARAAEQAGRTVDQWMRDQIPFGRFQAADETAAVVAFLCTPDASFTSGQAVAVAGAATP